MELVGGFPKPAQVVERPAAFPLLDLGLDGWVWAMVAMTPGILNDHMGTYRARPQAGRDEEGIVDQCEGWLDGGFASHQLRASPRQQLPCRLQALLLSVHLGVSWEMGARPLAGPRSRRGGGGNRI